MCGGQAATRKADGREYPASCPRHEKLSHNQQISADAEAAREEDLKHIGLAAAQKKRQEKNPGPRPVNNPAVSVIFANLMRMHQFSREQAAKKGHPTITVPLPNPEELLPPRQQYPMNSPPPPTSNKGEIEATTDNGKGKATDEKEA